MGHALCSSVAVAIYSCYRVSALGYLYSSISLNLIRPDNSRAVLAAGCLLGGMEDLCRYCYEACRQSISVETIRGWVEFIDTIPSSADGSTTPDLPKSSIFGLYAQRLRDDVFHFLVDTLPEILEVQQALLDAPPSSVPSGRDVLLQIYSRVPFEMFKTAVESPAFRLGAFFLFKLFKLCFVLRWALFRSRRFRSSSVQIR